MKLLITTIAALLVRTVFAGPIHEAAKYGDLAGVQAELDKGVDVDLKDERGRTPLHHAADVSDIAWLIEKGILEEKTKVAELLIAKGADVTVKDSTGDTPLHETMIHGTFNKGVAELLIANGADVNAKNDTGFTLLHSAYLSSSATIEFLIANGADVDAIYDTPFRKLTVIEYYDLASEGMWGMEAQQEMKVNIELIRKHGGKKYYEINPAEIFIFHNPLNKQIYISVYGLDRETYDILHSSDLKNWNVIKTITIDGVDNSIESEITSGSGFYKIRLTD
jgi:ankyrin repeat protein